MNSPGHTAAVEEPLMTARRIFSLVARELALVEEEFERQARSNIQVIAYIGDYLRACCEIGAILGGGSDEEREALRDFGMNLGVAFQLVDDLLDFTSDEDALGKAAGVDLLEGKVTLPLIYLLEEEPGMRPSVQTVMR